MKIQLNTHMMNPIVKPKVRKGYKYYSVNAVRNDKVCLFRNSFFQNVYIYDFILILCSLIAKLFYFSFQLKE